MILTIKYALFALVATLPNLAFQDLTGRLYKGPFEIYLSMGVGTLAGLVVKYILDKKYIFFHRARSLGEDGRMFILYSLMGLCTTLIFWGVEIGFDRACGTRAMRYTGAVLGLAIGYYIKYRLDKRFVFVDPSQTSRSENP